MTTTIQPANPAVVLLSMMKPAILMMIPITPTAVIATIRDVLTNIFTITVLSLILSFMEKGNVTSA